MEFLGNLVDRIGTAFNLPERGYSEKIAGGNTVNTGVYKPYYTDNGGVVGNAPYQSSIPLGPNNRTGAYYSSPSKTPGAQSVSAPSSGGTPSPTPPQPENPNFDPYGQLRNEISSGWDSYISSLDDQLNGLNPQRQAQEDIANSQYNQGVNTLGLQRTQGLQQLGGERERVNQEQVKTLRDLSSGLRNAFMAGNVYLGSRGAGDSSAADQYALALTKEGSRQRGDVMAQGSQNMMEIGRREENLNNIYNTEIKNLEETKNQKVLEISQWFQNAQNQIKQLKASGQLNKSQDLQNLSRQILDQAIGQMNALNQEVSNRKSALESWAVSNAKNINELKSNLQNLAQFTAQMPGYQQIAGTPQVDSMGNFRVATGYGSSNQKRDQFGNLI